MKYQVDTAHVKEMHSSIWDTIKTTFEYRKGRFGEPLPVFGHYAGVFKCGDERLVIHTDNVGTKSLVAQALEKYDTIGIDAIAMSVNDILCLGAEPLVGVDYLTLTKEDDQLVAEIMKGLGKGAEESECAIIGGETAIVPDILKGGKRPFDLSFTVVGRAKKMILGNEIAKGDVIVGLESSGLHSNGFTLARKVLDMKTWGAEMLEPTRIYAKPVLEMVDACDIHGIAHITGGAFSKLSRLNKEIGFMINQMPEPKPIFQELRKKVKDYAEMCRTFNMGIGMAVILPEDRAYSIINIAKKHGIEANIIGEITERKGIWIKHNGKEIDVSLER